MKLKIYRGLYNKFVVLHEFEDMSAMDQGILNDELREFITDYGESEIDFRDEERLGIYEATFEWDCGDYDGDGYLYISDVEYIGE